MFIQILLSFPHPCWALFEVENLSDPCQQSSMHPPEGVLLWTVFNLLLTGLLDQSLYGLKAKSISLQWVYAPCLFVLLHYL